MDIHMNNDYTHTHLNIPIYHIVSRIKENPIKNVFVFWCRVQNKFI